MLNRGDKVVYIGGGTEQLTASEMLLVPPKGKPYTVSETSSVCSLWHGRIDRIRVAEFSLPPECWFVARYWRKVKPTDIEYYMIDAPAPVIEPA